jgi:predicted MFS family arabinose efflux permease
LKIPIGELPLIYLVGGLCSIVTGPLVGRLSDALGKYRMFVFGSLVTIATVLFYTRLGASPIWVAMAINAIMFIGVSSRMIPAQALMSAIPEPASRGAFMSVSSSIQQISGGLAAVLAGMIVSEAPDKHLEHFDTLGLVVVGASVITLFLMYTVHRMVPEQK